jgi:hypothetical protein
LFKRGEVAKKLGEVDKEERLIKKINEIFKGTRYPTNGA